MDGTEIQFWGVVIAGIATVAAIIFNMTNRYYQKKQLQVITLFKAFELLSSTEIRNARKTVYDEYHRCNNSDRYAEILFRLCEKRRIDGYRDADPAGHRDGVHAADGAVIQTYR